jgi:zinc protease
LIAWGVWFILFQAYILIESIQLAQRVQRIRQNAGPTAEPNLAALRTGLNTVASQHRGRVFRSRAFLFGLPLIDVNVSDPSTAIGPESRGQCPKVARGWIAIGDDARGIILAVGSTARGFIAIGGRSLGVVSIGGVAVGLVAIGGLGAGIFAIGGLGLGFYAIGGLAIGWQGAAGGGAIAWDTAVGGFAMARHAAVGGGAFARDFALGGGGSASHFNDDAAKAALLSHPLKLGMDWSVAHMNWLRVAILAIALLIPGAMLPLMYRHKRGI